MSIGLIIGIMRKTLPVLAFSSLTVASLAGLLLLPPIPQDQSYHQFADHRTIFGIPNFWNVGIQLAFPYGWRGRVMAVPSRRGYGRLLLGVFLTGFGSSLYHWHPHDSTLFWDRLPMTLIFAALFALVIGERVSEAAGAVLLWPALAVGASSVLLWRWTDDLRLYFWVQFFPAFAGYCCFPCIPPDIPAHIIGFLP